MFHSRHAIFCLDRLVLTPKLGRCLINPEINPYYAPVSQLKSALGSDCRHPLIIKEDHSKGCSDKLLDDNLNLFFPLFNLRFSTSIGIFAALCFTWNISKEIECL